MKHARVVHDVGCLIFRNGNGTHLLLGQLHKEMSELEALVEAKVCL